VTERLFVEFAPRSGDKYLVLSVSHPENIMKSDLAQRFIRNCGHHKQQEMKEMKD